MQWELVERLLTSRISVILDWGFSKRAERDHARTRARELGATAQLIFLDASMDTLQERIAERNGNLPAGTFQISAEELDRWATEFEWPTDDEMTQEELP